MSLLNKASLIQIPSGYKDGTLYSAKPTNGDGDFTFSRGSNLAATRVNSDGLIEKGRENLLLQSNTFDTTWSNASTTETGGQTDKSGGTDAWKIDLTAGGGWIFQSISTSGVQTISVYAKAGTLDWVRLYASGSSTSFAYFDLVNGLVGITSGTIDTNIELISNGYYRIDMSFNHSSTTAVRIYPAQDDGDLTATSGNIYIQDAQLEAGLVSTPYIETGASTAQAGILEDMPRLDYSGGATCPSLLLEPQRSNLVEQSEYYGSYWNINDVTIISNDAISPEGIQNATRITESATLARHRLGAGTITIPTAGIYVSSVFMKKGTARYGFVHFSGTASYTIVVDLEEGIITDTATNGTIAYQNIEDYGNGWYRCSVGGNSNAATTSYLAQYGIAGAAVPSIYNNYIPQYTGSTSNYLYSYGAMLESGSYPTSYIPTYGASVTRGADDLESSNYNYQSTGVLGSNLGTIVLECETIGTSTGSNDFHMFGETTSISDGYLFRSNTGTTIDILERDANTTTAQYTSIADKQTRNKIGVSYDGSDVDVYVNGVAKSVSSGTPQGGGDINGFETSSANSAGLIIHQILLFPTKLSNDELATLTTL